MNKSATLTGKAWAVFVFAVAALMPLRPAMSSDIQRVVPEDHRVFTAPFCASLPKIDGNLDEPAWSKALVFSDFRWAKENTPVASSANTELRVMHDRENLYLGFTCHEPNMTNLTAYAPCNGCYDIRDDRLEIYFDTLGCDSGPVQCFIMNCNGIFKRLIWRSVKILDGLQPKLEVGSGKGDNYWTIEMRVPLKEIGKESLVGEICKLNVERMHPHRGSTTLAPSPPGKSACREMAAIYFAPAEQDKGLKLTSLSRGALSTDGYLTGENRAEYAAENRSGRVFNLKLTVENIVQGKAEKTVSSDVVLAGENERAELLYPVLGREGEQVRFAVLDKDAGKMLYSNTYNAELVHPFYRVFRLKDPLFEPLLDASAKKDPRLNGSILWQQPIYLTYYANIYYTSLKYANEYSLEGVHRSVKDSGFHFMLGPSRSDMTNIPTVSGGEWDCFAEIAAGARSNGWSTPVLYAPYGVIGKSESGALGLNWKGGFGFTFDPINARAFMDATGEIAKKYRNEMWAVCAGDEQCMQNYLKLIEELKEDAKNDKAGPDSPYRKINREVKEKYGFGKYGIPFNLDTNDPAYPFSHCAYVRWLQDKLRPVNKALGERVKSMAPGMPVMSEDCMGGLEEDISSFGEYAQIATLQLCHPFSNQKQNWACRTKIVKDISGLDYITPCPHEAIDGYEDGACDPEEIIELYSQLLRGGATGIHAWPAAMGGGAQLIPDAKSVLVGYPAAWKLLMAVGKQMKDLPPLKFPRLDSVIHLSETSSQQCRDTRYPWNALVRYENLFTHIGVVARGWFKFTSDSRVKSGKDKLDDYKVVYLPDVKYAEPELIEKLTDYCRNGGTLVCLDPDAFEYGLSGDSLTSYREKLFGVKINGQTAAARMDVQLGGLKTNLPVMDVNVANLEIQDKDTEIVGRFDNGKPAIVRKKIGKGHALFFAYLPVNDATVQNEEYRSFWTALHKELGCSTGHEIWRFKLPMPDVGEINPIIPTNRCLTGNYGYWHKYVLCAGGPMVNLPVEGIYAIRFGADPRGPAVVGEGKLTDRLKGVKHARTLGACGSKDRLATAAEVAEWIEIFKGKKPVEVVFSFTKACLAENVNLWFSGELNGIEVYAGKDGKNWEKVGDFGEAIKTGEFEVRKLALALNPQKEPVKHLKLVFKERKSDDGILKLAEVEIWGDCPDLTGSDAQKKQEFTESFEEKTSRDKKGNVVENWSYNTSQFPKTSGRCSLEKDAKDGQYALKITAFPGGQGAGVCGMGRRLWAGPGSRITLRWEARGKCDYKVGLACYDAEGHFLASAMSSNLNANADQWASRETILTVPECGKGKVDSLLLAINVAPGGDLLMDCLNVKVENSDLIRSPK